MRSLIAQISAAVVPKPMPVVVKPIFVERTERRWAEPQIVMHAGRCAAIRFVADGVSRLEAKSLGHVDLAASTLVPQLHRSLYRSIAAVLGAGLYQPVIFSCGIDDLPPLPNIVRNGFFYVNILARLASPNGSQCVPVIRRGNRNCVNFFIVQHAANICFGPGLLLGNFGETSQRLWKQLLIDIAQRRNPDTRDFSEALVMRLASAPQANHRKVNCVVWPVRPPHSTNKRRRDSSPDGSLDKLAAIYRFHLGSLPLEEPNHAAA